jgi:hypothetical protein
MKQCLLVKLLRAESDRQCSSKVQQPDRLTFDLHRPNMTF